MPTELIDIIQTIAEWPASTLASLSLIAGFIEYILPILPGDTAVVALGAIAPYSGFSAWLVWALTTAASTVGGLVSFGFGLWIRQSRFFSKFLERHRKSIDVIVERFEKRGAAYLAVNRFIPGLRSFFFIAAAFAELRVWQVLLWGFLSSAAWMGMLVVIAVALSTNLARLDSAVGTMNTILVAVAVGIVLWLAWLVWKSRHSDDPEHEASD